MAILAKPRRRQEPTGHCSHGIFCKRRVSWERLKPSRVTKIKGSKRSRLSWQVQFSLSQIFFPSYQTTKHFAFAQQPASSQGICGCCCFFVDDFFFLWQWQILFIYIYSELHVFWCGLQKQIKPSCSNSFPISYHPCFSEQKPLIKALSYTGSGYHTTSNIFKYLDSKQSSYLGDRRQLSYFTLKALQAFCMCLAIRNDKKKC